jgi:hypothetical protein
VIETFAWETQPGFAVHVLNYTNPAMHKGWIREFFPIGEQRVSFRIPAGKKVSKVELLRAGKEVPFRSTDGVALFTIPQVVDYEVAALYAS